MEAAKNKRYVALDVLRGMTVAGMILVNNPGTWSHIFKPLEHSPWIGCTPCDLVFPFFLFCVGVSMFFSYQKYGESLSGKSLWKLVRRSLLIFLIGFLLNCFPFYPTSPDPNLTLGQNYAHWLHTRRIFGVLQRIAMCYLIGGVLALWLKKPKKIIIAIAAVTVLHWALLWIFGDRGVNAAGQPLWKTLEG
ncbi:MAG: heparan-alpha-glucosaminide N-acetyltransferase domain-containing protein, partial [Bacteroidales bacterium]|nr:heparan-alpha-glucosaminide N-acetyltransferase domain-containing protein [Bacteroidales bacterium]